MTEKKKQGFGKVIGIAVGGAILLVLIVVGAIVGPEMYRSSSYDKADVLFASRDYQKAYDAFNKLGDYRDSAEKAAQSKQNLDYDQALADLNSGQIDRAMAALIQLAKEGFPEAQLKLKMLDEQAVRDELTAELGRFKSPQFPLWQKDVKATIDALVDMGVNSQDLIATWTEGFSYHIDSITVNGATATAEVTITCKQYHPAANSAANLFLAVPNVGLMTEGEMVAKLGELIYTELKAARPVTTKITIPCTKTGDTWTIGESAEYEYYKALFGISY